MAATNWKRSAGIVAALLVFGLLSASYSVLVPAFESSDEPCHLDYAQFLLTSGRLPGVKGSAEICVGHHPPLYYIFLASAIWLINGRPLDVAFEAFSVHRPTGQTRAFSYKDLNDMIADLHNLMVLGSRGHDIYMYLKLEGSSHRAQTSGRAGYFIWGGGRDPDSPRWAFLHDGSEIFPFSRSVRIFHLLRLIQLSFGVLTIYLAYRLALDFSADASLAFLSALAAATIPRFTFISGMLNNDNLLTLLSSLAIYLIVRISASAEAQQARLFAILGAIAGLAFLTKLTALFLLPLSIIAALLCSRSLKLRLKHAAIFGATFLAFTGWLLLRNATLYGRPLGPVPALDPAIKRIEAAQSFEVALGTFWEFLRWTFISFWGGLGWVSVPIGRPFILFYLFLSVIAAIGFTRYVAVTGWRRTSARALLLLFSSLALSLLALLWHSLFYTWHPEGRLLFPALTAISLILALGWREAIRLLGRTVKAKCERQIAIALAALLIAVNLLCLWFYVLPRHPVVL